MPERKRNTENKKTALSQRLKFYFRLHFAVTTAAFLLYASAAFALGPKFIFSDLQTKFSALADEILVVTATVLGPPVPPVATAALVSASGSHHVRLEWTDNENNTNFDITRDGLPLVTGLAQTAYEDAAVTSNATYSYEVVAHGPMSPGSATSSPVVVVVPDSPVILPEPAVTLATLNGKSVDVNGKPPRLSDRRPVFSGTTTIAFAAVHILVESEQRFIGTTYANANGYWEWQPPAKLSAETHTITVTAVDPDDSSRSTVSSFLFKIIGGDDDEESGSDDEEDNDSEPEETDTVSESSSGSKKNSSGIPPLVRQPPVGFSFSLRETGGIVQGGTVTLLMRIEDAAQEYGNQTVPVRLEIHDPKDKTVFSADETILLRKGEMLTRAVALPLFLEPGKGYQALAYITLDHFVVSHEASFSVISLPLFKLGTGEVTYGEAASAAGWAFVGSVSLLFFWALAFIREYRLSLHAIRQVTEHHLARLGFFGTRKGVRP